MTAPALRTYPAAPRTDLVEVLHGHRVADPFRGLEDAGSDETEAWSTAQDDLYVQYRTSLGTAGPFATEVLTDRLSALLGAGFVSPPAWRGDRRFFSRRVGDQEHAVVVVVDGDTERVLLDPIAIDPAGTTTLDAWQPS